MIYVLFGPSGAGKTTAFNSLRKLGYNTIITYTTRPIRENEINNLNYKFITDIEYDFLKESGELICTFEAKNGWKYGVNINDFPEHNNCYNIDTIIVLEPDGIKQLREKFHNSLITAILIDADEEIRFQRALRRGDNINEIKRRFLTDKEDFKGAIYESDFYFKDYHMNEVVESIEKVIGNVSWKTY